jgi:hypothetical protein
MMQSLDGSLLFLTWISISDTLQARCALPISAIDALSPAFQHTKATLLPIRLSQWAKFALVGLLAGEMGSYGCGGNTSFRVPTRDSGQRFMDVGLAGTHPAQYVLLIALLAALGFVFLVLLLYLNSVMRFVLFDGVLQKECRIRESWDSRQRAGVLYFFWQVFMFLATIVGLAILVGIPAGFGFAVGWLRYPKQHLIPLILGGVVLFFFVLGFVLLIFAIRVITKDFVVPVMALEEASAFEGWRRIWPMIEAERGSYAGYLGMKVLMALGAAVVLGIIFFFVILMIALPFGGIGAILVIAGKTAGLSWNVYTITVAVMFGVVLVAFVLYVVSLISVPAMVFFPAYSIYFFASRYSPLHALLHPAPATPVPQAAFPPPVTPPFSPPPEPIG